MMLCGDVDGLPDMLRDMRWFESSVLLSSHYHCMNHIQGVRPRQNSTDMSCGNACRDNRGILSA
jgi:hypothetical protein